MLIHGHYYEPEFLTWRNMLTRCKSLRWKQWYGHVRVYPQWVWSYEKFLAYVGRKPTPKHTLDRIDPLKGYEPGNVRWATRATQARNTKNHCTNKTGIRGVSWSKAKNKWRTAIYVDNKQKHVGYFRTLAEAAKARKQAELKWWRE